MLRHAAMPFVLGGALVLVGWPATVSTAIAGGWIDTVEIAPDGGAQPQVAMTPQGDVVVAWRADVSVGAPHTKIFRRVKPAGQGFDAIAGFGDIRATEDHPATAIDAQGRPWIAFHSETDDTVELLRGNVGDPTSFTGVATFSAVGSIGDGPQLAVGSEAAAVTYKDGNTLRLGTWSQSDGAADVELRDATNGEPLHARVTLDDAGNVMTAWTRDPGVFGSTCVVETRRRAAGAALSAIQAVGSSGIDEAPQCFDNDVDLALSPTGRVLASWYDEFWSETRYALAAPGAAFGSEATAAAASTSLPSRVRGLLGAGDDSLLTYLTDAPMAINTTQRHTSGGVPTTGQLDGIPVTVSLARNASETAIGAWSGGPCPVWAALGTVSGGLGSPAAIGSCGSNLQVAIDDGGDAAAVWDVSGGQVVLDIYDNTPPALSNVAVPATANPGEQVVMSATASDALSNTMVHWRFGDGEEADGPGASHAYATPGSFQVEVDAIDQGGNVTTEQRTIAVTKAGPAISTTATPGSVVVGSAIRDVANVTGGFSPTGTVTFKLYPPADAGCSGSPVATFSNVNLVGDTATSPDFASTAVGVYRWIATYSGDANNAPAGGACNDPNESITVAPAGGGSGGDGSGGSGRPDTTSPRVTGYALTNKVFRDGKASTPTTGVAAGRRKPPIGTRFRYTLSEPANVLIDLRRVLPGRREGGRCVKPSAKLRNAKKCKRFVSPRKLTRTSHAGVNSVAFSGRVGKKPLRPGSYRAVLTATDAAGNRSTRKTITFKVVHR